MGSQGSSSALQHLCNPFLLLCWGAEDLVSPISVRDAGLTTCSNPALPQGFEPGWRDLGMVQRGKTRSPHQCPASSLGKAELLC